VSPACRPEAQAQSLPRGRNIMRFLADRPEFAGVGSATAQRLWDAFGEDLHQVLSRGDADALSAVLPRTQAEVVCDAWNELRAVADAVVFLDGVGIDDRLARKAVDLWGEAAVEKLRENPYRLLTICPWTHVDRAARSLGVAPDDPRRQVAAIEAALYDRLDEKHTVTVEDEVLRRAMRSLGVPRAAAQEALASAVAEGAAIPCAAGYQPAGAAYAERYIEQRLRAILGASGRELDMLTAAWDVGAFLTRHDAPAAYPLTDEQRAAVGMAVSRRLSLLVGGAGVGKTTCLRAINGAARESGLQVHQLALAGRAAQRMASATGQPAHTIASWLGKLARGAVHVAADALVIVDEASMVDLPTLYRLLFHLRDEARLLLVGDVAQLPPIGYGLTLHRLVRSPSIPKVELTRVLRAEEATGIPLVSRAVRDGHMPSLPAYEADRPGCAFIECGLGEVVEMLELLRDDAGGGEAQIIAAAYLGPAGIDAINTHFHRYNAHGRRRTGRFAEGDPVIWTRNDYDRGLWNGSMGVVLDADGERVTARLDGMVVELARDELGQIDLAYAISCHKAQGSQWDTVFVPLAPSRLLDRALLYTAVTRARLRVVLVGSRSLLEQTVEQYPTSLARDVALAV